MFRLFRQGKTLLKIYNAHQLCLSEVGINEKVNAASSGLELLRKECEVPWKYRFTEDRVRADFTSCLAVPLFNDRHKGKNALEECFNYLESAVYFYSTHEHCEDQALALLRLAICHMERDTYDSCAEMTAALKHLLLARKILSDIEFQTPDLDIHVMLRLLEVCSCPVFITEYNALGIAERTFKELQPKLIDREDPNWLIHMFICFAKAYMVNAKYHPDTLNNVRVMMKNARSVSIKNNLKKELITITYDEIEFFLQTKEISSLEEIDKTLSLLWGACHLGQEEKYDTGILIFNQLYALLLLRKASVSDQVEPLHLIEALVRGERSAEEFGRKRLAHYYLLLIKSLLLFNVPSEVLNNYNIYDLLDKIKNALVSKHSVEYHKTCVIDADTLIDGEEGEKYQNYYEAIQLLEDAVSFFEKNGAAHDIAQAKMSLAHAWSNLSDPSEPKACDKSIQLLTEIGLSKELDQDPLLFRNINIDLACAYLNRPHGSRNENFKTAGDLLEIAISNTDAEQERPIYSVILANTVTWYIRSEKTDTEFANKIIKEANTTCSVLNLDTQASKWVKLKMAICDLNCYLYARDIADESAFFDSATGLEELLNSEILEFMQWRKVSILKQYMKLLTNRLRKHDSKHEREKLDYIFNETLKLTENEKLPLDRATTLICYGFYHVCNRNWQQADHLFSQAVATYEKQFQDQENSDFLAFMEKISQWQLSSMPIAALLSGDVKRAIVLNEQLRASQLRESIGADIPPGLKSFTPHKTSVPNFFAFESIAKSSSMVKKDALDEYYTSPTSWVLMPFLSFELGVFVLIPPTYLNIDPVVSKETDLGLSELFLSLRGKKNNDDNDSDGIIHAIETFTETNNARTLNTKLIDLANNLQDKVGNWIADTLSAYRNLQEQSLVILPFGPLAQLPMNLLMGYDKLLIENVNISLCPSLFLLKKLEAITSITPKSMCFIGDTSAQDLPFVQVEQQACHSAFGDRIHTNDNYQSLEQIKGSLGETNYWHFACHGQPNFWKISESYLLIGKHKLKVSDVSQLDKKHDTKLVALSACESGILDYSNRLNEFNGFPTEFIKQGANAVIATLWPVADQITTLFFAKFYEQHLKEGLSISLAFQITQNWLRTITIKEILAYYPTLGHDQNTSRLINTYCRQLGQLKSDIQPYNAPAYWAAFYLYGAIR